MCVCVCVLQKSLACPCLLGGLAAEEPGEPVARRPCRCHLNAEKTPAEHADINPRSAQEHEMETISAAGVMTAFILSISMLLFVLCLFMCPCPCPGNKSTQNYDTEHPNIT